MKTIFLLLAAWFAVQPLPAQMADNLQGSTLRAGDVSCSPLFLFTNGVGRIFPFPDGQRLEAGRRYVMLAIPERGFVFSSWQPVVVFSFTEYTDDGSGGLMESTSTVVLTTDEYIKGPVLKFTMEPEEVLFDIPNVRTVTQNFGWQANFVPVEKRGH
jgi:hypothetical protein